MENELQKAIIKEYKYLKEFTKIIKKHALSIAEIDIDRIYFTTHTLQRKCLIITDENIRFHYLIGGVFDPVLVTENPIRQKQLEYSRNDDSGIISISDIDNGNMFELYTKDINKHSTKICEDRLTLDESKLLFDSHQISNNIAYRDFMRLDNSKLELLQAKQIVEVGISESVLLFNSFIFANDIKKTENIYLRVVVENSEFIVIEFAHEYPTSVVMSHVKFLR